MFAALKRLNIYQKEMYPIISRLLLGYLVFGEIYHSVKSWNYRCEVWDTGTGLWIYCI